MLLASGSDFFADLERSIWETSKYWTKSIFSFFLWWYSTTNGIFLYEKNGMQLIRIKANINSPSVSFARFCAIRNISFLFSFLFCNDICGLQRLPQHCQHLPIKSISSYYFLVYQKLIFNVFYSCSSIIYW